MPLVPNTPKWLKAETLKVCAEFNACDETAYEKALRIGELMNLAQPLYKNGDWGRYLKTIPLSRATIYNYMKLAKNKPELDRLRVRRLSNAYEWLYPGESDDDSTDDTAPESGSAEATTASAPGTALVTTNDSSVATTAPASSASDNSSNEESTVENVEETEAAAVEGDPPSDVSVLQAKVKRVTITQVSKLMECWNVDRDTVIEKAIAYTFKHRGEVSVDEDDSVDSDGAAGLDVSSGRPLTGPAAFHAARERAEANKGQQAKRGPAVGANSKGTQLVVV